MIRKQEFGSTGHMSTVTLFGAASLGNVTQAEADETLDLLLEYGVNHIDTAASYGDAELRIGPWMDKYQDQFFLATKTGERTYEKAKAEFHRSLERLRVDKVDLIQLHNLVHPDDWDIAMGDGGALEAVVEAREEGLVDYIGVTGHGLTAPAMHHRSLEYFTFDSILFPYNYVLMQNERYAQDVERLLALADERGVAIQTIKSISRGPWATTERTRSTWYQPLESQEDINLAVSYVVGREGLFLNTVGDIHVLPKVLEAASNFERRPTDDEMKALAGEQHMTSMFA
ncbi:MAG: aldo/keto reductase [Caldilineaceae bacterium]|jgi:aryl-alcohol dehydrogenase-like predicted oxidoreductase